MADYKASLTDMQYLFREMLPWETLRELPGYQELDAELADAVLEEGARFCEEVLAPINRSGDEEGCRLEDGRVHTPGGFPEAYQRYVEGGWPALNCDPEHGGQGLPRTLSFLLEEMVCGANLSFGIYQLLTQGAYHAINIHGSEVLKSTYLEALASGRWAGTMCLTEPQSGTDLGLLRSRAIPMEEGGYRLAGSKIFISAGDHDLTENIIHLVLARTPDAPAGVRGISLFVVPARQLNEDGSLGKDNGVCCSALEHKMGIRASSTCVLNFEDARAELLGELHGGLRGMFTMMNLARLSVGVQGIGIAGAAYHAAVAYARERLQGRDLRGARFPEQAADPLMVHPDIRRMLLTMRAWAEGARALALRVATALDISLEHPDPECRRDNHEFVSLMTPIVKSLGTDIGFDVANLAVQTYGGHGYIRENGVEQYVRDARITQIYEGANGIQALDLVGRKLPERTGRNLRHFFHPLQADLESWQQQPELHHLIEPLGKAFGRLQRATAQLALKGLQDPVQAAAPASEYLRLFGLVAIGQSWAQMAASCLQPESRPNPAFCQAKLDTAHFYMRHILSQSSGLFASIMAGADVLEAFDEDAF